MMRGTAWVESDQAEDVKGTHQYMQCKLHQQVAG